VFLTRGVQRGISSMSVSAEMLDNPSRPEPHDMPPEVARAWTPPSSDLTPAVQACHELRLRLLRLKLVGPQETVHFVLSGSPLPRLRV
jgi:hypothetical protein